MQEFGVYSRNVAGLGFLMVFRWRLRPLNNSRLFAIIFPIFIFLPCACFILEDQSDLDDVLEALKCEGLVPLGGAMQAGPPDTP